MTQRVATLYGNEVSQAVSTPALHMRLSFAGWVLFKNNKPKRGVLSPLDRSQRLHETTDPTFDVGLSILEGTNENTRAPSNKNESPMFQ